VSLQLSLTESNFKFHLSNPQKALPWRERRIMTYCAWGCVQKCDLWAWRRNEKIRTARNFHASNWLFAQTSHVDVAPPPEILHAGSYPGSSYIFQISWKSVEGSRSCGGSKIALSHWLGPWLIQQLVLQYKPWLYVKDTKAAPECLRAYSVIYIISKLYKRKSIQQLCALVPTFAFRSIESLCWVVSNNYTETKNQRLGVV